MNDQVPPPRHKFRRNLQSFLDNEQDGRRIENDTLTTKTIFRKQSLTSLQMPDYVDNINLDQKDDMIGNIKGISSQTSSSSQVHSNTSNRISSTSRLHISSSSSSSSSSSASSSAEVKTTSMKSDLNELKSNLSELKNLCSSSAYTTATSTSTSTTSSIGKNFSSRLRNSCSLENILISHNNRDEIGTPEPIVTFPDSETSSLTSSSDLTSPSVVANTDSMKFEQKRISSALKTKVITDSFSSEKERANSAEIKRMQSGDVNFRENSATSALRARLDMDGLSTEKTQLLKQEQRSYISGDISEQEIQNLTAKKLKMQSDSFSSEQMYSAQSNICFSTKTSSSSKSVQSSTTSSQVNGIKRETVEEDSFLVNQNFDDLESLNSKSNPQEVKNAIQKYSNKLDYCIRNLNSKSDREKDEKKTLTCISNIFQKTWAIPNHGHDMGLTLCDTLRKSGGLDLLISNCTAGDKEVQFVSGSVLAQCLSTENRNYVVQNGLEKVVSAACVFTGCTNPVTYSRIGTGILEHLFKHSEETCSNVIKLGGLDTVLYECRKNDVEVLRNCAVALANLSLYGGGDNHEAMIQRKAPMWLFPLAFHDDDNVKYYACLAITVLVANIEIEAAVLKSGTLELVEPFVTSHSPFDFGKSSVANARGQSKNWLKRLVPVLSSKREESRNLAAFHFCMEAGIKKEQSNLELFREIGAIEPLKQVASCPNAVASKFAAQALRLIGEEVPHKLSQQVPVWSTDDVREWVKQIGFSDYANNFVESRVDGDLLLQLTEEDLKNDIGLTNGIKRRRFTRELQKLKKMADYSSKDRTNINAFLQQMCPQFSIYTYNVINAGVDCETLKNLSEDQLQNECGITNSIHRLKIMECVNSLDYNMNMNSDQISDKNLDVFVSYRRSNGSQLASLLKVHLQIRGFSVFLDVERLEAGKFDNNLLQSIMQAKHFLLVLTPQALERCVNDQEGKDWVHREIVAALQAQCNIIPIIDNFQWPEPELLPEDMRSVCHFNGVRWIHDYQDACVDKLERFMRGELNSRIEMLLNRISKNGDTTPTINGITNRQNSLSGNNPYQKISFNNDTNTNTNTNLNGNGNGNFGNHKEIVSTKD